MTAKGIVLAGAPGVNEATLKLLKAGFLLLLYLFLFRAVRAVYLEISPRRLNAPAPSPAARGSAPAVAAPRGSRRAPSQLRVVAPPETAGRTWPLEGEMVIGRGAGCAVRIDDTFASQSHARLFPRDGSWYVEDVGSTNGTVVNRQPISAPTRLRKGDKVQVGQTVLELGG